MVITSIWDLQNITSNLSADFVLNSDIDASATSSWNSGKGFDPIGGSFTGSLNGNGYTISNLFIDRGSEDYIGLFGEIGNNGIIKNVNFMNADITGNDYVGIIAGSNRGTVSHCQTGGTVVGSYRVGGFMGQNAGGTIYRSKATATTSGDTYVGGALGFSSGSINHLRATGSVSGYSEIGGLIGKLNGAINYCCATGSVSSTGIYVAGLVGYNHGSIRNCHASGRTNGDSYVGGMIGYNYRYYGIGGLVDRSHSTGRVTGRSGVGGMIGVDYSGSIAKSFWDTQSSGQSSSAKGIGKTTTEMKTKSTFTSVGWDFTEIWWINETNTYPLLYIDDDVAPVARAGNNIMIDEDNIVEFDGGSSTDDLRLDNHTWSFTDVDLIRAYGTDFNYLFKNPGIFKVTLRVLDFAGNPHHDSLTVTVNDTTPPLAEAGEDNTIDEDSRFFFNGNMSSDNYMISNYTWSFTDVDPVELKGVKPSYVFNNPGVFEVELKVYDTSGHLDTDLITINVIDITPPEADAGPDLFVKQGTNVVFDGTNSSDNVGILDYKWTFYYGSDLSLSGSQPEYQFDEPIEITVILNVTDESGLWDLDIMNLTVYETTKPVADAGPDITIEMGETV
ncbi:MAG: PKD domain-containing protein, partial [Candidatus Thermoplasmatota archaeon]|nr:PKD domain-containing protein [Candidatus Thermoplasmatota archaeon]